MAAIDLMAVQPHKVSRDLTGYSVLIYGEAKTGKTTTASHFPDSLLLAFEKGYNALPGVMAQPINTWGEFKSAVRQLKKDELKAKFKNIIVDTADIASDYCTQYICDDYEVDTVGDIPYGKGYGIVEKEFDTELRKIVQYGYGLIIISHDQDKQFKTEDGEEYMKLVPTLEKRAMKVVSRLTDIIAYVRTIEDRATGATTTKAYLRGTPRFLAGSRFKCMVPAIKFGYEELVEALHNAIDEEAKLTNNQFVTTEKETSHEDTSTTLDFDEEMEKVKELISSIPGYNDQTQETDEGKEFANFWQPKIADILNEIIGRGKKITDVKRTQVDQLHLVYEEVKELIDSHK